MLPASSPSGHFGSCPQARMTHCVVPGHTAGMFLAHTSRWPRNTESCRTCTRPRRWPALFPASRSSAAAGAGLPSHVALIMDGNTRWSVAHGVPVVQGHAAGAAALTAVVRHACSLQLKQLTVFAFCADNRRRPPAHVDGLFSVMQEALDSQLDELHAAQVKLSFLGDLSLLPQQLHDSLIDARTRTFENRGLHLTVAINYSGTRHVAAAARAVAAAVAASNLLPGDVDEAVFGHFLARCGQYTEGNADAKDEDISGTVASWVPWEVDCEPDLLIRTSGEQRLSNYLLWHFAWTELYFTDTLWPDFDGSAFDAALQWYSNRKRRFGAASG